MTIKNIFLAGFSLMLVAMFTSCSTSVEIAKRQFSSGYYVHVTSKKGANASVAQTASAQQTTPSVAGNDISTEPVFSEQPVTCSEEREETPVVAHPAVKGDTKVVVAEPTSSPDNSVTLARDSRIQKKILHSNAKEMLRSSGTPGIILLVLCIIVPPLAIIFSDEHTSKQFWLDFLLWIIGWGALVNPIAGIFWLLAIIYALSICF